jgi:hypothetical protein
MRCDLLPVRGIREAYKVMDSKLNDHSEHEWMSGLKWSEVLSNLKKHLSNFELGIDYDDKGNLTIANVATDALILAEYFSINPAGDDRIFLPINRPVVALDIDDVCLDFIGAFQKKTGIKLNEYWNGSYQIKDKLNELSSDEEFWTTLPTKHLPTFEPDLYITSRSIPVEWTMKNLEKNGFPCAPVYCVPWNESKIDLLKEHNVSILIDDKVANYLDATNNGIFCYLMDAPHNQYLKNIGHRRIYDLNLQIK